MMKSTKETLCFFCRAYMKPSLRDEQDARQKMESPSVSLFLKGFKRKSVKFTMLIFLS
jgi:hypothetical protein